MIFIEEDLDYDLDSNLDLKSTAADVVLGAFFVVNSITANINLLDNTIYLETSYRTPIARLANSNLAIHHWIHVLV